MKNYYEILEVSPNASYEVIEKAYRTLVKKYHPDLQFNQNSSSYEKKIRDITEAYNILSDKISRTEYDIKLKLYNKNLNSSDKVKKNNINQDTERQNNSNSSNFNIKKYISAIGQTIYNETKKDKKERNRDLIALLLTIAVVGMLVFIFSNVPFLKNLFTY